ncbi:MAG: hypothetical protein JW741_19725 [Sedimentisphaerales bacterium]|nr:hypothetical protein [Sedimentisphaerales bacterium]
MRILIGYCHDALRPYLETLTLDNGREFARPLELERKLDLPIYFAHPYYSW